ncbi:hypothetical protein [Pedobacter sp. UBA5917]|jgi:hypothetical protein|uniref:hypothetical protein n=1 Tax=Pedobacter sp. UBA5917 TaxID=1947061 RepID=UPI0025FBD80B|nr:hypothetical protein [Pedobacter sp. UBA5917]
MKAIKLSALFLLLVCSIKIKAQQVAHTDFVASTAKYDFSKIWVSDSIADLDEEIENKKIKAAEAIGFIGDNYQRFYIHLISVIKDIEKPNEYFAYGKTMVKNNICSFQGKIKITEAGFYKESDKPKFKQGFIVADILFFEDQKSISAGSIKGKLTTHFALDAKGNMFYDTINMMADGFSNNEFVGAWTGYKSKITKKCNWGDYRIPGCGDLDIGAGEFSVNEKYLKNGWENYQLAYAHNYNSPESKIAFKKESEKWWK